jgi:hypothetical protein
MNAIKLSLQEGNWMATYFGPCAENIALLFGTTTLPTAFTSDAGADEVLSEIRQSNPGAQVYLNEEF